MDFLTWILIAVCISQSAVFSGLNLAFFSISKLRLEIEVSQENPHAEKVLKLREDSNFLLVTILWGNVGVNVLLAILSDSILSGVFAFLFSTVLITIIGEILPQAYFSRNALRMASFLSPVVRFYQVILFLIAKPTALLLDKWLGKEAITFFKEDDFRDLVIKHIESAESDIGKIEGQGVLGTQVEIAVGMHPTLDNEVRARQNLQVFLVEDGELRHRNRVQGDILRDRGPGVEVVAAGAGHQVLLLVSLKTGVVPRLDLPQVRLAHLRNG